MALPTDQERKINEVVKTGQVAGIRTTSGIIEVKIEFEEGVFSPWMPYSLPFVGGTVIFAYPALGQGGLIMSEGGESHINRFIPDLDVQKKTAGLGEFDFKIFFENGDFIHHNSGNLTINSASTVIVNTQDATLNASSAVVNASDITTNGENLTINAAEIQFNGNVTVAGSFAQTSGATRSAYTASFTAPVTFNEQVTANAEITANAEVTVKGKAVSTHKHNTPAGMSEEME